MVRAEVMRGRFRNSFAKPEPFKPGQATKVHFDLHDVLHTFEKGHRLMVQVQSTWFPARRPQPTDVRAQHLRGQRAGFPDCHAPPVSFARQCLEAGGEGVVGFASPLAPLRGEGQG